MIQIRRLVESDAPEAWELRLEALENDPSNFGEAPEEHRRFSVERYAERLRHGTNENFIVGAFQDSKLVGTTGFHRETSVKRRHKGVVWGVYVSPSHRGQGIARRLLTTLIEIVRTIPDLKLILLSVNCESEAPRRLYRSVGFEPWGVELQALKVGDRYFDEEYMALRLDENY